MVQNRGIDISVVSQFDIRRLPEFDGPVHANTGGVNVTSCYIPIYPGSQIWFEYTVEPPHPPQAAYFFKLVINGRRITAWDCTEKHGYHGKMAYSLERSQIQEFSGTSVQRRGFKFCNAECDDTSEDDFSDCIEIRVHRIEYRRRIHGVLPDAENNLDGCCGARLQVINGGFLEPGRPLRRYKYQLVDPVDEPYATFRFFYRSYDFLKQNNIIPATASGSSSVSSSVMWYDAPSISDAGNKEDGNQEIETHNCSKQFEPKIHSSPVKSKRSSTRSSIRLSPTKAQRMSKDVFVPLSDSDESLRVVARDSIEDLPSNVSRSPNSPRSRRARSHHENQASGSPTRQSGSGTGSGSPRAKMRSHLALDLKDTSTKPERGRRPLSPFTSGGLLRCLVNSKSNVTESSSSSTTRFEIGVFDEKGLQAGSSREESRRDDSRTGESLIRRLSRRIKRRERS